MDRATRRATRVRDPRTEQGTARRPSVEGSLLPRSRAELAVLLLFFLGLPVLLVPAAAHGEGDVVLPESGIHYPGGFDRNTVGEVRGTARALVRPSHGPVTFRLETENGVYTVLTSPVWYWDDLAASLADGTEVVVRGSKSLGRDEGLYIVAQEVRIVGTGASLLFRSTQGRALWGGGGGRGGGQGGGQAGQGGAGGPGGFGGMRRGGRR